MMVIEMVQSWQQNLHLPSLLIVGVMVYAGFYMGKTMKYIRLPSIIGFMLVGVILGPSLFNFLDESLQDRFSFIAEIALGFVAASIGLELDFKAMRKQGTSIMLIILSESFLAFLVVTAGIYLYTRDLPLALILGAIAPASAPAGTVAVIQEYKARGKLTRALYTVVGFDDGLGIIIFGFAAAIARSIIVQKTGGMSENFWSLIAGPFREIGLGVFAGAVAAVIFCFLARKLSNTKDIFILIFASVLIVTGISIRLHLSLILSNMVLGLVAVNMQPQNFIQRIREELTEMMPLLFILFFVLAGANLHLTVLPSLGIIGLIYMVSRTGGLMGGAWFGATIGRAERTIRKYLGMGILSQAGVAIGLALIVKHEFTELGSWGAGIGSVVISGITATSILFEVIGPILTKVALKKAGEIQLSN